MKAFVLHDDDLYFVVHANSTQEARLKLERHIIDEELMEDEEAKEAANMLDVDRADAVI